MMRHWPVGAAAFAIMTGVPVADEHSNANGSTVKTRTEMPDGSRTKYREKEMVPNSGSSIEKKSTRRLIASHERTPVQQ